MKKRHASQARQPESALVAQIVTGESRAPLFQRPLEPPGFQIGDHFILMDVRESLARQGCLTDQVGVVEQERSRSGARKSALKATIERARRLTLASR